MNEMTLVKIKKEKENYFYFKIYSVEIIL